MDQTTTLDKKVLDVLLDPSAAKALATNGAKGLNAIPVSTIRVVDNKIWLIDYFFDKTRTNVKDGGIVVLIAWVGLIAYQIKAKCQYYSKGERFEDAADWVKLLHPNRIVQGLLELQPLEVNNISIDDKV